MPPSTDVPAAPPATTAPQLSHINIVVNDISAMSAFLSQAFGFVPGNGALLDAPWVAALTRLPNAAAQYLPMKAPNGAAIELLCYITPSVRPDAGIGAPNEQGYRHIGFNVGNIDTMVAQLQAQGYEFLSPVQTVTSMGVRTVYFYGPEGILMQLTQALTPGATG
jgi:catechol 2,3-dioxygenase-like lactoylglutathione lyase family enzyme